MIKESYSQSYQDVFVSSVMGYNGTYLELGARKAITHNNTYLLEKNYGWRGVSVELDMRFKTDWKKSGRKNPVVWANALTLNYQELIECYNLEENIDYLSCDLEPANITFCALTILIGQQIFPKVITFEHDFYRYRSTDYYKVATDFLNYHGYKIAVDNVTVKASNQLEECFFETWYVRNDIDFSKTTYQEWKENISRNL